MKFEKGFSSLILIIGLAIIIFGFIGWRLLEQNKNSNSDKHVSESKVHDETSTSTFVIAEWNVMLKDPKLNDILYIKADQPKPFGHNFSEQTESVILSTKSLQKLNINCTPGSAGYTALGVLYRSPSEVPSAESLFIKQIGDYFFYYSGPQSMCSDSPEEELDSINKLKLDLPRLEAL